MTNKRLELNSPLQLQTPISAGVALILSGAPAVLRPAAASSYDAKPIGLPLVAINDGSTATGQGAFDAVGGFDLTCVAKSGESPDVTSAIAVGDALYANINTGTLDTTTGLFYGFTIDKNQSGIQFGTALSTLTAGSTGIVTVRLRGVQG